MIRLNQTVPMSVTVAFSGGVDSVAVTDFLSRTRDVTCAFFHHGIFEDDAALAFTAEFCTRRNIPLIVGFLKDPRPADLSPEEHWRNCRYSFLESIGDTVVTGHNLDDCVETFLYSSLHGTPKVIPNTRNNIVRPFLTTPKSEFVDWCQRKDIKWYEDPTNSKTDHMRNYIRHNLMPHALHVNPGLYKTVKKIVERKSRENEDN